MSSLEHGAVLLVFSSAKNTERVSPRFLKHFFCVSVGGEAMPLVPQWQLMTDNNHLAEPSAGPNSR